MADDALDAATEGFADSDGVKIHYVTLGEGPLVVMIHGFPDFWYTWRAQMPELAKHYQVVAIDTRGYNKSDKPKGVENYAMPKLVGDVAAVIRHLGRERAVIVGHDWGGAISWAFAMQQPQMTERLIILNLPHPAGMMRELATNPQQKQNAEYARIFQKEGPPAMLMIEAFSALGGKNSPLAAFKPQTPEAAAKMAPMLLAFWVRDPEARKRYVEAFQRSDLEAMLNYYKANYPRPPYEVPSGASLPKVKCPVLMFHGLKDQALLPGGLNNTWDYIDNELTLITIPEANHFVQQDAADLVTQRMAAWLRLTETSARSGATE